jgi:hypothetical protein
MDGFFSVIEALRSSDGICGRSPSEHRESRITMWRARQNQRSVGELVSARVDVADAPKQDAFGRLGGGDLSLELYIAYARRSPPPTQRNAIR